MQLLVCLALCGLVALSSATPVSPAGPRPLPNVQPIHRRQGNDTLPPCAKVSQAIYDNQDNETSSPTATYVPAKLAWDCVNSIPLNVSSAKRLLEQLPNYINWQSTIQALKNPPSEYTEKVQPAVDVLGGLEKIAADIDSGKITKEYDFGWTLYTLIQSAHDGHFSFVPDSVNNIFNWGRPVPLVSVSEDGEQLPSVFAFYDVLGMQFKNISYTPSPVVEIDGQEVTKFLEEWSQHGSLQDRDALYNNLFYSLPQVSLGSQGSATGMFSGGGRGRFVYPGPTTTLKFANGTEHTMENYARVFTTFRNIQTGEDLARWVFFYGEGSSAESQPQPAKAQGLTAAASPGYPDPVVPGPVGLINGFYINAPGYEDVAVLQVPSFVGSGAGGPAFQKTTQTFLPKALADGKTKLIIDLQANSGGTILQGYDMFKQLFPSLEPYGGSRFRYTEAADLIGMGLNAFLSGSPRPSPNYTVQTLQESYFDYRMDMTADGKPFQSWGQKAGPVTVNGDNYTAITRWNLSDVFIRDVSGGIYITGYGQLANVTGQPRFKAENIVLLTDGYCASTCTIFSEFMTKQAGVKTIAMGGRSNSNRIQAIGGVKGVNNYQYGYIQSLAQAALKFAPADIQGKLSDTVLKNYQSDLVFQRSSIASLNTRDGLPQNDTSGIALQFIYEEADCRLYYTPEMTVDATAMWKAAADAQWGDNGKCVGGYDRKRGSHKATTKLTSKPVKLSHAASLQQFEAFEKSFTLETDCQIQADGFMQP